MKLQEYTFFKLLSQSIIEDVNNIDNYSLKDLKILKENIERISSFGFDEEEYALEDTMEEKGTVLKKHQAIKNKVAQKIIVLFLFFIKILLEIDIKLFVSKSLK